MKAGACSNRRVSLSALSSAGLRRLSTQSGEGKVRAHVRDKFSRGERFGQIGVRSRSKALQAGFLSCPGGQ